MRNFILSLALTLAATSVVMSSSAQTRPPGAQQPAPSVRPPVQVAPNATVQLGQIPVIIQWREGDESVRSLFPAGTAHTIRTSFREPDHDGDGVHNLETGGSDCDDDNARRSTREGEVVDAAGVDEDCNYYTIGTQDRDRDGYVSWQAMNIIYSSDRRPVAVLRGPDCDDDRADTHPGSVEAPGDLRDNDCDGEIDVVRPTGHGAYCPPTQTVAIGANGRVTPCGAARGDTSQLRR